MMNDSARSELYLLAVQNGYNAQELVSYIDEDKLGGYHVKPEFATWPGGSGWESELQMLYSLVRYLKPDRVVEIGTLYGASATHLATALQKNGKGRLSVVDNRANGHFGELIPLDRWEVIDKFEGDGGAYLETLPDNSIDMIFEDAGHGEEDVYRFTVLAMRKLKPGGLLVNHDAMHDTAMYLHPTGYVYEVSADDGAKIRAGLARAGAKFQTYKPLESDCGFAVTKKEIVTLQVNEPGLSEAQVMHHTLFGLTYRASKNTDDELMEEVMEEMLPSQDAQTWSAPLESDGLLMPGKPIEETDASPVSGETTELPAKKTRKKRVAKDKS